MDRRITVPPVRDELSELADTFNHMLDRLEAGFKQQQRHQWPPRRQGLRRAPNPMEQRKAGHQQQGEKTGGQQRGGKLGQVFLREDAGDVIRRVVLAKPGGEEGGQPGGGA